MRGGIVADVVEIFKAILEIEEKGDLKRVQGDVKAAEQLMAELHAQFKSGALSAGQYFTEVSELAEELVTLRNAAGGVKATGADDFFESLGIKADKASKSVATFTANSKAVSGGTRNSAMALLEFSRGLEDAQYGIAGVLNNLPNMLMYLGIGTGLVGVISIASVAVAQLVKHWDDLAELFGNSKVETEAQAMERLAKATNKTADETARLAQLKKGEADRSARASREESLASDQSDAEQALGQSVRKAVTEGGGFDSVVAGLAKGTVDARKAAGDYRNGDGTNDTDRMGKARDHLEQQAKDLIDAAINSNDIKKQRAAISTLKSMSKDGGGGFAAFLDALDPAREKAIEQSGLASKKATEKRDLAGDKADDELERNLEAGKRRKADARKVTDRLDDGPLGALAEQGKLSAAAVERAMKRAGSSPAEIARLAGTVGDQLRRGADGRVKDFAAEHGTDLATARKLMGKERADAEAKGLGLNPDGPGLPKDNNDARHGAAQAIAAGVAAGMSPEQAQASVYRELRGTVGDQQARALAGRGSLAEAGDLFAEQQAGRKKRTSQVIDSAGLADSIQQSVGGQNDTQKQALDELKKSREMLLKIVQNTAAGAAPVLRR